MVPAKSEKAAGLAPAAGRGALRRGLGRAGVLALGFTLGLAPFLLPFLDPLLDLIPRSLFTGLRVTTALLGGVLALLVRERESLGPLGRKALRGGMFAAPAGLILLVFFHWQFVVRLPFPEGRRVSEIIAPPRIGTCPCTAEVLDAECFKQELSLDPDSIARCWQSSRLWRIRLAWSLRYVLMIGGGQIFLGPLGSRSRGARWPWAAPAPRASAGRA